MIESSDEPIGVTRLYCNGDKTSSFTGLSVRSGVHGTAKDANGYAFGLFAGLKKDNIKSTLGRYFFITFGLDCSGQRNRSHLR